MSTDTHGCSESATKTEAQDGPRPVALLEHARVEAAEITAVTSASLYAALQAAAGTAIESSAIETVIYDMVPPVAFATGAGNMHVIEQVRVNRFRGLVRGISSETMMEATSPHVELFTRPVNAAGEVHPMRGFWSDLDQQIDASEIADLFPTASLGTPEPETCDDECVFGETFDGTVAAATIRLSDGTTLEEALARLSDLTALNAIATTGINLRAKQ